MFKSMRLIPAILLVTSVLFVRAKETDVNGHVFKVSTSRGKIPIEELSKLNTAEYLEQKDHDAARNVQSQKLERIETAQNISDDHEKCGGTFSSKQTIIYSPNYPYAYPKNTVCTYIIKNLGGKKCDYHFQFLEFSLENSNRCVKDRLKILDNEVICGNRVGSKRYRSKTDALYINFSSDDNVEDKGFKILVTQQQCLEKHTIPPSTTTESQVASVTTRSIPISEEDTVNKNVSFVYPVVTDVEITQAIPVYTTAKPSVDERGQPQFHHVPQPGLPNIPINPPPNIPINPLPNIPINPLPNIPLNPFPNTPINPNPSLPTNPNPSFPINPNLNPFYPIPPKYPVFPIAQPNLPDCCANNFADQHFLLSSPGFPQSNLHRGDCQYRIFKSSPNSCRLRIKFRYFWSGVQDERTGCPRGFLEIDGRRFCGCRSGLIHELQWGYQPIIIRHRNEGVPNLFYSGFVLEITQLECPYRYLKDDIKVNKALKENSTEKLYEFDDTTNRVTWPKKRSVNILPQNVSFDFDDSDFGLPSFDTKPVKINTNNTQNTIAPTTNTTKVKRSTNTNVEYYFFDSPWIDDDAEEIVKQIPEEVTSKILLPNGFDNGICRFWGLKQWLELSSESLWQHRPLCLPPRDNRICEIHNLLEGEFQSPNFPSPYPSNLDICYRFLYRPGLNTIRLWFIEFTLEESPNCSKDRLVIGNQAYCGHALQNRLIYLRSSGDRFPDIRFITDSFTSSVGFKVQYRYIN